MWTFISLHQPNTPDTSSSMPSTRLVPPFNARHWNYWEQRAYSICRARDRWLLNVDPPRVVHEILNVHHTRDPYCRFLYYYVYATLTSVQGWVIDFNMRILVFKDDTKGTRNLPLLRRRSFRWLPAVLHGMCYPLNSPASTRCLFPQVILYSS